MVLVIHVIHNAACDVTIAVMKHIAKNNMGGKPSQFCVTVSYQKQRGQEFTLGRNLKALVKTEAMKVLLTGLLPMIYSGYALLEPRFTSPGTIPLVIC